MKNQKSHRSGLQYWALASSLGAFIPVAVWADSVTPDPAGLEEIVVTARKREESLKDTPVSITAFSAADMASRGARTFDDLLTTTPNVTVQHGTTANGLEIRGIGYNTRNIGIEAGATIYVDGVYTGRPDTFNQDLTDIARVEVLRGPQGTLFGKNSIAGVVSIVTNEPTFEDSGRVLAEYGNQGIRRMEITANEALGSNVAFRGSVTHSQQDGYFRDLITGQNFNSSNSNNVRLALRIDPNEDWRITLRADQFEQTSNPRYFETLLGDDPEVPPPRPIVAPGPFTTVEDSITKDTIRLRGASSTVQYRGIPGLVLTSITGYRVNYSHFFEGEDDSARNLIEINWVDSQKQFTQEFRGAGTVGKLDYVAGLYYFQQRSEQSNEGILGTDFAIPPLGIPGGIDKIIDPSGTIRTKSYAAYLDLTYKLTDSLDLIAGGRVNREQKDFDFSISSDAPALFYAVPPGRDSFADTDFSPTAGVRYHFNPDLMAYARYAKGFKAGGWNADFVSTAPGGTAPTVPSLRFQPEKAATSEVGIKSTMLEHTLSINASVFYTDFTNLQVAQFFGINLQNTGNQLSVTSNAGSAVIKGAELESVWLPFRGMQLSAGLGFLDARYDQFANVDGQGSNANGKRMENVPKETGNLSALYSHPLPHDAKISIRGDYSYISSRYTDPLNSAIRQAPSYWVANGQITYTAHDDAWEISVLSRNITNHLYIVDAGLQQFAVVQSSPVRTVAYGQPRTFAIQFQARF